MFEDGPPLVRMVIRVGEVDVPVAVDVVLTGNGTRDGADSIDGVGRRIYWSRAQRNKCKESVVRRLPD